ncbi:MAG: hypothetical protein HC838_16195 [Spirulinaceae cyanobacterium RM2_2_10]|nr:hypothetical protein [Spirulinaceae cyanobacterium RM2_2_10]
MSYDPNLPNRCVEPPVARIPNHDFTYTTEPAGILRFAENTDENGVGYQLDGIEGYIFARCSPEPGCMPEGTVKLYRLYHPVRDDYAIFPESELAQKLSQGYISLIVAL